MVYEATVYNVMIASPSDVSHEQRIVREVIHDWNAVNSENFQFVLMPISWDTHSRPAMGNRPQAIINKQVLEKADLLLAMFWTRIGSPTGESPSGTIEEIEKHIAAKKPAMLYFSSQPVKPESVDPEQYAALQEFKEDCMSRGLIEEYESLSDFQEKLSRQVAKTIGDHLSEAVNPSVEVIPIAPDSQYPDLSDEAKTLLLEAAQDKDGQLIKVRASNGLAIQTNGKNLCDSRDPRIEATWVDAVTQLVDYELLEERGRAGPVFAMTSAGYRLADFLAALQ